MFVGVVRTSEKVGRRLPHQKLISFHSFVNCIMVILVNFLNAVVVVAVVVFMSIP